MRLPHKRDLLEIIPLAELYTTYKDHERLTVFANKGRECVSCDRVGTFIILSRETSDNKQSRRRKSVGWEHVDLYTDDFVLMTVDHITPKSVGKALEWSESEIESLDNKQTMCDPCNSKKGHKLITNEELAQQRKNAKPRLAGVEIIRQLVDNIHRLNGDDAILHSSEKFMIHPSLKS